MNCNEADMKQNWLDRQIARATANVNSWPKWMRDATRMAGGTMVVPRRRVRRPKKRVR